VGYDDNRTTGLTGGSGALPIWSEVMAGVRSTSWEPSLPDGLDERWIEYSTGLETTPECSLDAVLLAFAPGVALPSRPGCAGLGAPEAAQPGSPPSGIVERVKGLLDKVTR
jgi:penicillin-binding protein 1B